MSLLIFQTNGRMGFLKPRSNQWKPVTQLMQLTKTISVVDNLVTDSAVSYLDNQYGGRQDARYISTHNPPLQGVHSKLKNILSPLDKLFPLVQRYDLGPFVHWRGNATAPMHRWLRYREAYSPELIDKLNLGKRILDPFSGCGSIPIGAATRQEKVTWH